MTMPRRNFIEYALAAASAGAAIPAVALGAHATRRGAANDRVRLGVIGVRGRGRGHIAEFMNIPNVEIVAICDPDSGVIDDAMEAVPDATYHRDIRAMLDDPGVDAVSIATPNHWHALATVWALDAGKHVYVEKPVSHTFAEGRAVINAARRAGKIVQHGTQARSHQATRDAMAWLQAGGLGEVTLAHGLCYKKRDSIGAVSGEQTPPSTLDYDLWTGPAAMEPLRRRNLHYDWHWDFNTGNGDIGNQGVHQLDIARWGLGLDGLPTSVQSVGARVGYEDDGETPNSQLALFEYDDAGKQIIFEVRGLQTPAYRTAHIGVVFFGEVGYMVSAAYAKVVVFDHDGAEIKVFQGGGNHFANFIDAVRADDARLLRANTTEAHHSTALCHLANTSHHLGAPRTMAEMQEPFRDRHAANRAFLDLRDHLRGNHVDPATESLLVGPRLHLDGATETFTGESAAAANVHLSRDYRSGYAIPSSLMAVS